MTEMFENIKGAKIINLTPHAVNIITNSGDIITFEPSGNIARCKQETVYVGDIDGIPLTSTSFGEVEDLPLPSDGCYYIVSRLIMSACPNRSDLLGPNELVRDDNGNIIGCRSFSVC